MRWMGLVVVLACGLAEADSQLATGAAPPPPPLQVAADASLQCGKLVRLIGQEPGVIAHVMKQHALTPITLETIVLPADTKIDSYTYQAIVTVKLGNRIVRGLLSRLSGNGCMRPDHRHAVDRDGNIYQFDGPAGVVDYTRGTCHTARGWEPCDLAGQTDVLYVVPDRIKKYAGQFGSSGSDFYPF